VVLVEAIGRPWNGDGGFSETLDCPVRGAVVGEVEKVFDLGDLPGGVAGDELADGNDCCRRPARKGRG